jgi:hypothetical protein
VKQVNKRQEAIEKQKQMLEQQEEEIFSNKKLLTNLFQGEETGIKLIPAKDNKSFILIIIFLRFLISFFIFFHKEKDIFYIYYI